MVYIFDTDRNDRGRGGRAESPKQIYKIVSKN